MIARTVRASSRVLRWQFHARSLASQAGVSAAIEKAFRDDVISTFVQPAHHPNVFSQPCEAYMAVTHPDGSASQASEVNRTLERFDASTLATYARPAVLLSHGKGLDLWAKVDPTAEPSGSSERHYLDFSSGIAVNSLGHADDEIAKIAGEQAGKLVHSSNLYHNEWSGELADRMVNLTRELGGLGIEKSSKSNDALKVFLANSGTEANEGKSGECLVDLFFLRGFLTCTLFISQLL